MQWFSAHPYLAALIGATALLLFGAYIVKEKTAVQPQGAQTRAWGGAGGYLLDPTANTPAYAPKTQGTIYEDVRNGAPFYYDPELTQPSSDTEKNDDFDFDAFLATLSHAPNTGGTTAGGSLLDTAYSFIPGGLISTSTPDEIRTPTQQALYTYGNDVGSIIQSFESSFPDAARILKNQFEDRDNPVKNEALRDLAKGLADIGYLFEAMEEVPPEIKAAHLKIAASYKELGERLGRIPDAKDDQELVDMMLAYNTAVDTYVKDYVALAILFSAHGVKFTPYDSGSVFTFTNASL